MKEFPPVLKQLYATLGTSALFVSHGYVLGLQAIMLAQLRSKDSGIQMDLDQESWMMSMSLLIMFPSQLMGGFFTFKYGRRPVMVFCCLPMICSTIMLYLARSYVTLLFTFLIFGTVGAGFAVGSMYIAEVTSPRKRTMFVNFKTASVGIGITVAHFLGFYYNWRDIILNSLIPAVISLVIGLTIPESPLWLASNGRFEQCRKSFEWFRGKDDKNEVEKLIESRKDIIHSKELKNKLTYRENVMKLGKMIADKAFLKAMGISFACIMFVDMTGKAVFGNYIIDALTTLIGDQQYIFHATLALDVMDLVTSMMSCIAAQKFKMRTLLFKTGVAAIAVLMLFCLASYLFANNIMPIRFRWVTLILIIIYFSILNIGVVPTLFCILNEITPLSHRELGLSVTSFIFVSFLFTSVKITPYLMKSCDLHGTFLVHGIIIMASLIYLYFYLPETHCKTLQDIEEEITGKNNSDTDTVFLENKEPFINTSAHT